MANSIAIAGLLIITILMVTALFILLILSKIANNMNNMVSVKENEIKTNLYNLYSDLDLSRIEDSINNTIKSYINKWVLVNITTKGDNYIKDQEVEELITYVTSTFILEMSEVHLFYVKCLTNIDTEDDLIRYIREKTKFLVLDFITEFNNV